MTHHKQGKRTSGKQRRIAVRGVQRATPNVRKLSQALISIAVAAAEAEAQRDHRENSEPAATPSEADHGC